VGWESVAAREGGWVGEDVHAVFMSEDFSLAASSKRTTMCTLGALELFLSCR